MPGITVAQTTCRQVEHTKEECEKHTFLITLSSNFVNGMYDTGRIAFIKRKCIQQRVNTGHEHGSGSTLAADITNTEE